MAGQACSEAVSEGPEPIGAPDSRRFMHCQGVAGERWRTNLQPHAIVQSNGRFSTPLRTFRSAGTVLVVTCEDEEQFAWQAMEAGDYASAMRLLKPLAERNSEFALMSLGWIYQTGAIGAPDPAAACSFYEHATKLGSAEAYGYLGSLFLDQNELEQAKHTLNQGAALGDEACQSMLQTLSDNREEQRGWTAMEAGQFEEARELLEPLAARQNVYALLALGWIQETGKLGVPNPIAAISHYQRAVKAGSADAHRYLATLLLDQGRPIEARGAFERGADAGNMSCMFWLGKMMLEGDGGPADTERGRHWLQAAAAQGHFYAKRKLLALEQGDAASILKKLSIFRRIIALIPEVVRESLNDPDSDKLR